MASWTRMAALGRGLMLQSSVRSAAVARPASGWVVRPAAAATAGSARHMSGDAIDGWDTMDDVERARRFKEAFGKKQGIDHIQFVDCSPPELYQRAHFLGAINVPSYSCKSAAAGRHVLTRVEMTNLAKELKIGPNTTVYAYDHCRGVAASRFVWTLWYYGIESAFVPSGGWEEWVRRHQPIGTGNASTLAHESEPATQPIAGKPVRDLIAYAEDLFNPDVQIVDVRSPAEFSGENLYGNKRGGHCPGAVNVPVEEFMDPDFPEHLRSEQEREALMAAAGIDKSRPVIAVCQSGIRGAYATIALADLGYQVSNFDGAMGEWLDDDDLPVETGP